VAAKARRCGPIIDRGLPMVEIEPRDYWLEQALRAQAERRKFADAWYRNTRIATRKGWAA
jgi:hypothetical protein